MTEEKEQVEALYHLAVKSAGSPQPKRVFLGWKCPKCDSKLNKKSVKEMIFVGDAGTEFTNQVGKDENLPLGVYTLFVDHFTCKCGYEFARAKTDEYKAG